jgi:2-methylcitrate dehydratase PrpD
VLVDKFEKNVARVFAPKQRDAILRACLDPKRLEAMAVNEFMDLLAV